MANITFRNYQEPNFVFNNKYSTVSYNKTSKNNLKKDSVELSYKHKKEKFDYSKDDGKISPLNKLKNFAKGIISPITSMFKSPKNFLMGVGAIAGGAALIVATGGAAAPVLVALGVTGGAVQLGVSAYKASTAKTDKEAEEAWLGMGAGTSAVVGSVAGAKSALKASGFDSGKMNCIQATIQCFKNLPKNIANSFNAFKSGAALTNLKNMFVRKKSDVEPTKNTEQQPKLSPEEALDKLKSKSSEVTFENLDPDSRTVAQNWWNEINQRCNGSSSYDDLISGQFDFAHNFDPKTATESELNALKAVRNEYCKMLCDYNKSIGNNEMLADWGDDGMALFNHFEGKYQFTDPKRISSIQKILDNLFGDEYKTFSQSEEGFSSVTKSLLQRLKNAFDNNSVLTDSHRADGAQVFESVLNLCPEKNIKIYRLNLPDNKFVYYIAQSKRKGLVIIEKNSILSIMSAGKRYLESIDLPK